MRVFLDDKKDLPEGFDLLVRTFDDMMQLLIYGQAITHLSLDWDLGEIEKGRDLCDGIKICHFISRLAYKGQLSRFTWDVHSEAEYKKQEMEEIMRQADEQWDINEKRNSS